MRRAVISGGFLASLASLAGLAGLGACGPELAYPWDGRRVVCSRNLDHLGSWDDVTAALDDAADRGVVAVFHAHVPGTTIPVADVGRFLGLAAARGLEPVTFRDLASDARPRPAYALAFDDNAVDAWYGLRGLLRDRGARVTFFVSRWAIQPPQAIDALRELAADGHDLEPHSVAHLDAVDHVAAHGLDAYLADEVLPSLEVMRAAGFEPTTFAYPFGRHDAAIDAAVLAHVPRVRTNHGGCP